MEAPFLENIVNNQEQLFAVQQGGCACARVSHCADGCYREADSTVQFDMTLHVYPYPFSPHFQKNDLYWLRHLAFDMRIIIISIFWSQCRQLYFAILISMILGDYSYASQCTCMSECSNAHACEDSIFEASRT